jgi:signal peptidase II
VAEAGTPHVAPAHAWGPRSALGFVLALLTCALDQASKLWLLDGFHLAERAPVHVAPFTDLVLTWNTGISYGLLAEQGPVLQGALLLFKVAAVVFLWIWLARTRSRLTAAALGLIIGGAVGNALDRLHWPGVMDFMLLHAETAAFTLRWYVFNLADVAIVAGVFGLLYEAFGARGTAGVP